MFWKMLRSSALSTPSILQFLIRGKRHEIVKPPNHIIDQGICRWKSSTSILYRCQFHWDMATWAELKKMQRSISWFRSWRQKDTRDYQVLWALIGPKLFPGSSNAPRVSNWASTTNVRQRAAVNSLCIFWVRDHWMLLLLQMRKQTSSHSRYRKSLIPPWS